MTIDFEITSISNLALAKAYFTEMGCSSFHMSREYPDRYEEYKQLAIGRDTELVWTYDSFAEMAQKLKDETTEHDELWVLHSRMADLLPNLETESALLQIYDVTEAILGRLRDLSKLIVAETINGRQAIEYRPGLIFFAFDLNRKDLAKRFAEISLDLILSACDAGTNPGRCEESLDQCRRIIRKLGLKIPS